MGKIDVSGIEGFEAMSAEQKVEALMGIDVPDKVDLSAYVPKSTADKYASEAADYKRKLREKQTDEEASRAETESKMKEIEQKYNDLLKKSTIAEHTAKYLSLPGYDERMARETAEALFEGDMDKVFANQQKANELYAKQLKAEALKNMTPLQSGSSEGGEPENIRIAKMLGHAKAQSHNSSNDIVKQYLK